MWSLTSLSSLVHKRDLSFNIWIFFDKKQHGFPTSRNDEGNRIFKKNRDQFKIVFDCLINSCGSPTGLVVDAYPDIPLPPGRGAHLEKMRGGGVAGDVRLAVRRKWGGGGCRRRSPGSTTKMRRGGGGCRSRSPGSTTKMRRGGVVGVVRLAVRRKWGGGGL